MTSQPTTAEDDLADRLAAADHAWARHYGHMPHSPAYIRHLARHLAQHAAGTWSPVSNRITGHVAGPFVQAGDIHGNVIV